MLRPAVFVGACMVVLAGVLIRQRSAESAADGTLFQPTNKPAQPSPICPWREPESDLKSFYPPGAEYASETRILSGNRMELTELLGRAPTGDENLLHLSRIFRGGENLGAVLVRRVKGSSGAIEVVVAMNTEGRICGLRVQRHREPEPVEALFEDRNWVDWFVGKGLDSSWDSASLTASWPAEAILCSEAIVRGARELLVLAAVAERATSKAAQQAGQHPNRPGLGAGRAEGTKPAHSH